MFERMSTLSIMVLAIIVALVCQPVRASDPEVNARVAYALAQVAAPGGGGGNVPFFLRDEPKQAQPEVSKGRGIDCGCPDGGKCGCQVCLCDTSYEAAYQTALKKDAPLLIFVGQVAKPIAGCVSHSRASYCGDISKRVVVGLPNQPQNDFHEIARTECEIKGEPTTGDIQRTVVRARAAVLQVADCKECREWEQQRAQRQVAPTQQSYPTYIQQSYPMYQQRTFQSFGGSGCTSGGCR